MHVRETKVLHFIMKPKLMLENMFHSKLKRTMKSRKHCCTLPCSISSFFLTFLLLIINKVAAFQIASFYVSCSMSGQRKYRERKEDTRYFGKQLVGVNLVPHNALQWYKMRTSFLRIGS